MIRQDSPTPRTIDVSRPAANGSVRPRVLHVVLDLEAGGLERVVADLIRTTDPGRFELHLLAVNFAGRYASGLEKFATVHVLPPQSRWSMLFPSALARAVRQISPEIVHSHSGIWYKAALAAHTARVPFVIHTDHGRQYPDPFCDRLQDRVAAHWTDVVVAVSPVLAQHLARFIVTDPRKVTVIPNGIDTNLYRPTLDDGTLRAELGIPATTPIIGSIGRFDHIKGYDVMIDAFALLRAQWTRGDPPVLVIAGDGPERERFEASVRGHGLAKDVHVLGWRMNVQPLQAAMTIFTLASRSEGTSISLLEAMSAGRCPVVTRVGGNPDVLSTSLAHRLVPSGRPDLLAHGWLHALLGPEQRAADEIAARRRVTEHYSLDSMRRQYEQLYALAGTRPFAATPHPGDMPRFADVSSALGAAHDSPTH